jgi:hypothetical protein
MAVALRSEKTGRARSRYDGLDLYEIVREVALVAVDLAERERGERLDPRLLTEAVWDKALPSSPYPDAPKAKKVCERLADRDGDAFPWRELLTAVLDPKTDVAQLDVARTRSEALIALTPDAVYFSLNLVAQKRGQTTLTISDYARAYDELIAADRRRRTHAGALQDALLTVGQIVKVCGSWPDALRHAGLQVNAEHYTAGRVSLREAALLFHAEVGVLPTTKLLRSFAALQGFAVEDVDWSRSWAVHIAEFRDHIKKQTGTAPAEYVPARTTAAWNVWLDAHAEQLAEDSRIPGRVQDADPSDAGIDHGEGGRTTTELASRAYRKKRFWPLKSEILEQLHAFLAWELPNGLTKRTTTAYKRWAQEAHGRPSLDSVQKFGSLEALLKEARRDGAVERAREQEAKAARKAPADRAARLHCKHVGSPKGQALLALLRESGEPTRAELERELGWPQRTVNTYLAWLVEAGAIVRLGETGRQARYRARR